MAQRIVVGIHEAKTQFSKLVKQAQAGEEIVVENYGKPVAMIVGYEHHTSPRKLGFLKGPFWMAPDFNDEEEMADLFGIEHPEK
jgi:prevent-host-death family protein